MFEKYTEKARRIIFFARYEVSELGSKTIETEHLLLGLLREDEALISRFLPKDIRGEVLRVQIERQTTRGEKIATALEIPLSVEAKEVLASAAEESESLGHGNIDAAHLLLGLLRTKDSLAEKVLRGNGIDLLTVRQAIKSWEKE